MVNTFVVIEKKNKFYVKNLKTNKVGSNVFQTRENAETQRKNRERFIKLIANKSKQKDKVKDKGKKKKK